jgi:hypothetical protein
MADGWKWLMADGEWGDGGLQSIGHGHQPLALSHVSHLLL